MVVLPDAAHLNDMMSIRDRMAGAGQCTWLLLPSSSRMSPNDVPAATLDAAFDSSSASAHSKDKSDEMPGGQHACCVCM